MRQRGHFVAVVAGLVKLWHFQLFPLLHFQFLLLLLFSILLLIVSCSCCCPLLQDSKHSWSIQYKANRPCSGNKVTLASAYRHCLRVCSNNLCGKSMHCWCMHEFPVQITCCLAAEAFRRFIEFWRASNSFQPPILMLPCDATELLVLGQHDV